MSRTIYRWRIDKGLAFNQHLVAFDPNTDADWDEWDDWRVQLDLADRRGLIVVSFDSEPGADGTVTFSSGLIEFNLTADATEALDPTTTLGRGKEKAQLSGLVIATDPMAASDPYSVATVKAVIMGEAS